MGNRLAVLEYHDLSPEQPQERSFHSPYVLRVSTFERHLCWLKENGFRTISLDDLHSGDLPLRPVLITFDDGHISNLEHAFPLLEKYGFTATFFLVADRVGTSDHLNQNQIRQMQAGGMFFGSHSVGHPYLPLLSEEDLERELVDSKARIETILGHPCMDFCIPHGFFNHRVLNRAEQAGYRTVLTERMGYHTPSASSFKILPRFTIKAGITPVHFENILLGRRLNMAKQYATEWALEAAKAVLGCRGYLRLKSQILRTD